MKKFFEFRRKGGFVGIDVGSYAIKVAEAVPSRAGPVLRAFGQVRLPTGSLLGGVLKDPKRVTEKLNLLLENLKIKSKKAIVSISSYAAIIKRIKFRLPEDKELDIAIQEEAEAYIPFNLEDVYLDYQIFSEEENIFDILLVAARKEIVEEVADLIQNTGLIPIIVDVDILAINNLFEYVYQPDKPAIFIDIGATKISIVLWAEGGLMLSRDLSFGLYELTEKIQNELNVSFEEAELLKVQGTTDEFQLKQLERCFLDIYDRFLLDFESTLNYFRSFNPSIHIEDVYICGGGSQLPHFLSFLKKNLKFDIHLFSPFTRLKYEEYFDEKYLDTISKEGIVALGLSIRELFQW